MKLASHNSGSYACPTKWWMRLFQPFSRCQSLSLDDQLALGVELFDIRVRVPDDCLVRVCHGLVEYEEGNLFDVLERLDGMGGFYVRILLESRHPSADEAMWFASFCAWLESRFPHVIFFGGHGAHKPNWHTQYYAFSHQSPYLIEMHASVMERGWKKVLPYRYARINNKGNYAACKDVDGYLMQDFVELSVPSAQKK